MKEIPLTQGKYALVDDEDFEALNKYKWYAQKTPNTFYALRSIETMKEGRKTIRMQRLIMNAPDDMFVDHINHNGLDNRKVNLRVCTHKENCCNKQLAVNNTSGFRGVVWHKQTKKWHAQIKANKTQINLGYFTDKEDAIRARKSAELKYFGDFTTNTALNN